MKKEKYVAPEIEVIEFEVEDVITTSSPALTNGGFGGAPEQVGFSELFK